MTYTYALLRVSPAAYAEIREKMIAAGSDSAVTGGAGDTYRDPERIDMRGIALVEEES